MTGSPPPGDLRFSATTVWRSITHSPDQTPYSRWCAGQATAHADRLATLHPADPDLGTVLAVRDETWHQTALDWYTMLTNQPEPALEPATVCTVAHRDAIRTWLDQPAPHPYAGTMDEFLALEHLPDHWAGPLVLSSLIEHAQYAGLFGIPHHTIRLHSVVDERTGWDGHLLTIHTPAGGLLAGGPFNTRPITDSHRGATVDTAVAVLRTCAGTVDTILASHGPVIPAATVRARPFPALAATQAPAPPGPNGDDPLPSTSPTSTPASAQTPSHPHIR